jgi:hypothetical protein
MSASPAPVPVGLPAPAPPPSAGSATAALGPRPFGIIVRSTTRAILGRRRTLLVLLFLAVPLLLALLARAVPGTEGREEVAISLLDTLSIGFATVVGPVSSAA